MYCCLIEIWIHQMFKVEYIVVLNLGYAVRSFPDTRELVLLAFRSDRSMEDEVPYVKVD